MRECVVQDANLSGGGLYGVFIGDGVYIGEAGNFEVRFNSHLDVDQGNKEYVKAKKEAQEKGKPIDPRIILATPTSTPATIRHVYETFVNSRARATSAPNLNINVFDGVFLKNSLSYSGAELESLVVAVKEHIGLGRKLPIDGTGGWAKAFGHLFRLPIFPH